MSSLGSGYVTPRVLCDPEFLAIRDGQLDRLARMFDGSEPGSLYLRGFRGVGNCDPHKEPELWIREALDDLAGKIETAADRSALRPPVIEYGPYGVHFIDRMFGAKVYELRTPGNWQADCLDTPVGELQPPDLNSDPTWSIARRAAEAFVESGATVPLFGLPTLSSALNTYLNLYGERGLLAMAVQPDGAMRDLRTINQLIIELHRWYREHVPEAQLQPVVADERTQPPGFGQICGCSTQLLSAEMYADLVAPLDAAALSVYPAGGMIHLCGTHTQHIAAWREMCEIRAVQVNDRAAEDLAEYVDGLRSDQILYINPCDGMPVSRIRSITRGERSVIVGLPG